MNITDLGQRPQWLIFSAIVMATTAGGARHILSVQEPDSPSRNSVSQKQQTAGSVEVFQASLLSLSASLQGAAGPNDLKISAPSAPPPAPVPSGRSDPFAPVVQPVGRLSPAPLRRSAPAIDNTVAEEVASTAVPQPIPPVPVSSTVTLPALPPVSLPPLPVSLPSVPVSAEPISAYPTTSSSLDPIPFSTAPQDPLETIELSGVVQVGDLVGVIIRESGGQTSRHVFAGDYLANGQVLLKAVDLSAREPLVILEYQGNDYHRVVGSGNLANLS